MLTVVSARPQKPIHPSFCCRTLTHGGSLKAASLKLLALSQRFSITLPQKRDKVNRNFSCLIRFLQKSLRLSCQLFYTTPTFFIPHQRSAAPVSAPASVGAGRSPPGSSTRGSSRDQVLLPLPQNRRKHWVFAGFLFARVVWEWGSLWFRHLVFPSVRTCSQPLPPPQAPKTHPTSAIFA